ncbi:MAG: ATPase [Gallionellales bacterium RIFCSPLOWO2_12_FULL_59_22]|nr:MAG: ATPase [Gallionellales bacterium RIFCSPLOWO2_02_FULL_59_110]OGT04794.1 MAG: ATPase [Gallionellales bacterium RIFCSPLOWO2_02_58_13]OGT13872.1 MAG: ATPase [Gallionellales bacterium RIFCSPLOWO2_12_FULL_59_22]
MAVIAVFNQKGGVGKTTTCLNVTAALHIAQQKPIALDMDPQGHLTLASGAARATPDGGMAAFFKNKTPLFKLLRETQGGWQIIPASLELAKIDAMLGSDPKAATLLRQGLREDLALTGAPILIDCCPMLGVLTLNALLATDRVLIPVSADFLSLQGVHRLDSALNVLETRLNRKFERRVVMTRFVPRRKLAYEIYDRLRERYGALVCETRINENVALATSPMHSKDVFDFAPHSPGAADYRALTQELWDSGFFV